MSNLSDFRGGVFRVGDAMAVEERGESFPRGGELWLRTGALESAATYTEAASLEHMRVVGLAAVLPASITVYSYAHNSAGTWVVAYGDATNIARSTDDGATWALVAHNAGGAISSVAFGAGIFVAVGNDAANFFASSSPTGATWTVRTGTAITTPTANTARVKFGGGKFVAVAAGTSATGAVMTSTDGITWTTRNGSQAIFSTVNLDYNGTIWLVLGGTTAAMSSADGITWTNRTAPVGSIGFVVANTSLFVCTFGLAPTSYYTTTDAITFTQRFMPVNASTPAPRGFKVGPIVTYNGTYFIITSTADGIGTSNALFYCSADGISGWKRRWLSAAHSPNTNSLWMIGGYGTKLVAFPTINANAGAAASTTALYTSNFPSGADFIGSSYVNIVTSGASGLGQCAVYLRIR